MDAQTINVIRGGREIKHSYLKSSLERKHTTTTLWLMVPRVNSMFFHVQSKEVLEVHMITNREQLPIYRVLSINTLGKLSTV